MVTFNSIVSSRTFNPGVYGVRTIILFLRKMFEINQELGLVPYGDDLNKEEAYGSILITSKHNWETKYRNKRPSIIVSHENIIFGINGTMGTGKIVGITNQGQRVSCSDLISFPIVVECLAEADLECSTLASIVNIFLTSSLKPLHSFGFQILGNPAQSPTRLYEGGSNTSFIASVVITVQQQRQYSTTILSDQLLQEVKLEANNQLMMDIKEDRNEL